MGPTVEVEVRIPESCNKIAKWRNGRREGLKNLWGNSRAGSSPALATDRKIKDTYSKPHFLSIKLLI